MNKKITYSEWFFVLSCLGLLLLLIVNAHLSQREPAKIVSEAIASEKIDIKVEGAVQRAGIYRLEKGATVGEILNIAGITKEADLSRLKMKAEIKSNAFFVPYLPLISVQIKGYVKNPGTFLVRKKSRVCDLADKIEILKDGDGKILSKKSFLKDGDVIEIPRKKLKKER